MKLPTPVGLLHESGAIGQILRQLPRGMLDEAVRHRDPWSWLAACFKKKPVQHWRIGTVEMGDAERVALIADGFNWTNDSFRKTFEAASSQWKAFNVLAQVAQGAGAISNHDLHLKILAAEKRGDSKTGERLTKKLLASKLKTVRGRQWLLVNKEKRLNASPEMREWARREYEKHYAADVRRLGKKLADEKWKNTKPPRFKMNTDTDYIVAEMTVKWLVGGQNGFPGLCFMSDELLADFVGHSLPAPTLYDANKSGWKTIRTIRERIGLKKAEILFTDMEQVGDNKWVILNRRGKRTHLITFRKDKPFPPEL